MPHASVMDHSGTSWWHSNKWQLSWKGTQYLLVWIRFLSYFLKYIEPLYFYRYYICSGSAVIILILDHLFDYNVMFKITKCSIWSGCLVGFVVNSTIQWHICLCIACLFHYFKIFPVQYSVLFLKKYVHLQLQVKYIDSYSVTINELESVTTKFKFNSMMRGIFLCFVLPFHWLLASYIFSLLLGLLISQCSVFIQFTDKLFWVSWNLIMWQQ